MCYSKTSIILKKDDTMKRIALKIEKSKEKISPFGGSVLIFELLKNLGLIEKIDKYLPKKACNRGYKPYVKILSMIVNFNDFCKIVKERESIS